jgi:serine phosphatase RsbU (regulator of sigma subunit)
MSRQVEGMEGDAPSATPVPAADGAATDGAATDGAAACGAAIGGTSGTSTTGTGTSTTGTGTVADSTDPTIGIGSTGATGTGTGATGTGATSAGTGTTGTGTNGAGSRRSVIRWGRRRRNTVAASAVPAAEPGPGLQLDLARDPLAAHLLQVAGPVEIARLQLDSPALTALRAAGATLVVPLISSGALVGVVSLGPRLSERGYSSEDRRLLRALAGYAAPAMRVGQLVREQQEEARSRERIEQELKVAQVIQQQFLPKAPPELPGWEISACYRPARTVGGDFYDFIPLPGDLIMIVIGDVTDKGVPAALVMASTHALLRGAATRLVSPGAVLSQVNDQLRADTPANMFVTCLALLLNPASGLVTFANAGHDVPYVRTGRGVAELRARGMPLGLMPGMSYEEKTFTFAPGDCALLHSDGLAEAHSPSREMFGFHRVAALVGKGAAGAALIDECLAEYAAFTGPGQEQEDDITLVTVQRAPLAEQARAPLAEEAGGSVAEQGGGSVAEQGGGSVAEEAGGSVAEQAGGSPAEQVGAGS